ncbi:hypothetical protein SAMN04244560_02406 [Thermoanaerobacter thermohydrosulfuricus]|uniref:DUF2225 domain-containing protein n=1 Tax=Thermoanaerobacter thermohydrosulfuricus TaxID=1516 RepID=A0A1G7UGZ3_THETY|nr:DUF2225 domain-containing protein [Thermoanaerobacter thermohydrosulfuricus]SDG46812.1 hypothetical protein SAMN04244560_02406 [Thermoanaerobacter thermohydrosulfuricus]
MSMLKYLIGLMLDGGVILGNKYLYDKKTVCPVCKKEFTYTKVRSSQLKVEERERDFYTKYKDGINPFFYEVIVCPNCGYAALESEFDRITNDKKEKILSLVTAKWVKREFSGERTPQKALEAYLLALYCSQIKEDKPIVFAKTCLRIAWIYRILNDKVNEEKYLKYALDSYIKAYSGSDIYEEEEVLLIYMIAELNRMLGNREEALKWYNKVINHPDRSRYNLIVNLARDGWQSLKE